MNCVYILKSAKNGRYYIGSTNDLERRLVEHNSGKIKSLRNIRPLIVVFKKQFKYIEEARKVEQRLKKFKNKNILDKIIQDQEIKLGPVVYR